MNNETLFDFKSDFNLFGGDSGGINFGPDKAGREINAMTESFMSNFQDYALGIVAALNFQSSDQAFNAALRKVNDRAREEFITKLLAIRKANREGNSLEIADAGPGQIDAVGANIGAGLGLNWDPNGTARISRQNVPALADTFKSLELSGFQTIPNLAEPFAVRGEGDNPGQISGCWKFRNDETSQTFEINLYGTPDEVKKQTVLAGTAYTDGRLLPGEAVNAATALMAGTKETPLAGHVDVSELHYCDEYGDVNNTMRFHAEGGIEQSVELSNVKFGRGQTTAPLSLDLFPGTQEGVKDFQSQGFELYESVAPTVDKQGIVSGGFQMHKGSLVLDIAMSGQSQDIDDKFTLLETSYQGAVPALDNKLVGQSATALYERAGEAGVHLDSVQVPVLAKGPEGTVVNDSVVKDAETIRNPERVFGKPVGVEEPEVENNAGEIAPPPSASKNDVSDKKLPAPEIPEYTIRSSEKDRSVTFDVVTPDGKESSFTRRNGKSENSVELEAWGLIRVVEHAAKNNFDAISVESAALDATQRAGNKKADYYLSVAAKEALSSGVSIAHPAREKSSKQTVDSSTAHTEPAELSPEAPSFNEEPLSSVTQGGGEPGLEAGHSPETEYDRISQEEPEEGRQIARVADGGEEEAVSVPSQPNYMLQSDGEGVSLDVQTPDNREERLSLENDSTPEQVASFGVFEAVLHARENQYSSISIGGESAPSGWGDPGHDVNMDEARKVAESSGITVSFGESPREDISKDELVSRQPAPEHEVPTLEMEPGHGIEER